MKKKLFFILITFMFCFSLISCDFGINTSLNEEKAKDSIIHYYHKLSKEKYDITLDDVEVYHYYGEYNGYYISIVQHNKEQFSKYTEFKYIDDVEFIYCSSNEYSAWKDGEFYSLEELYENNEITKEELSKISKSLHEYELSKYEEKVLCNVTMEDKFKTDQILVGLSAEISAPGKTFDKDFFVINGIEEVVDKSSEPNQYNSNPYRNYVNLILKNVTKEEVITIIKLLEKIPGIRYAEPNWILEWA